MTLKKVAAKAGVAIETVRKALRDDPSIRPYLKDRVLEAVESLDYHPNLVARALRERATQIVPISVIELTNPYFGSLAQQLSACLSDHGLEPALCMDPEHLIRLSRTLSPCGSILGYGHDLETLRLLQKRQKVVAMGVDGKPVPGVGMVFMDLADAYRSICRALWVAGRRKVAVQSITMKRFEESGWSPGKYMAFAAGLKQYPLEIKKGPKRDCFDRYQDLVEYVVAHPGAVDTVLCENDQFAALIYGGLMSRGIRVPDDVLIVGCDANLMLPGNWSIKIDTRVMALGAVALLVRMLGGEKNPAMCIYKPVALDATGTPLPVE